MVVYTVAAAALAQLILFEAHQLGPLERFSEWGFVEWTQSALLAAAVAVAAVSALRSAGPQPLLTCLALAFAILLVRENDQVLEVWLPHGIWKWPALALLLWAAAVFFRHRDAVLEELRGLVGTFSLGVLIAGFATLVFSRLFGRGELWEQLMGDQYVRAVKNAAEEGVELFALGLLLAGVVELVITREKGRA